MKAIENRVLWRNSPLRQSFKLPDAEENAHASDVTYILPVVHPLVMAYIASCEPEHRMIYISPQIIKFGFPMEAWLTATDFRLQKVHAADFKRVSQALTYSHGKGEIFDCCYRLHDSGGSIHWLHDRAEMVCDDADNPLFISGAMLDITEQINLETELAERRCSDEPMAEHLQISRRMAFFESCDGTLCDQLSVKHKELDRTTSTDRRMIVWRVAAAGEIA